MNNNKYKERLRESLLLQTCFDFTLAGQAHVFISKLHKSYVLVVYGVHIVEDIFAFAPNYKYRYKFDSLYYAILAYNKVVTLLCSNIEWYHPDTIIDELRKARFQED